MAFEYPQYREQAPQLRPIPANVAVPERVWSEWVKLMDPNRDVGGDYKNRNDGHNGSYRERRLPDDGECGIYEWKMVNPCDEEDTCVVYLGKSCSQTRAPLRDRILQYCRDGGHKDELINHTLGEGYELHVRYRIFSSNCEAEKAEKYLLDHYNYAWNIRDNGIREPLRDN